MVSKILLAALSVFATIAALEVIFRALEVDLDRKEAAFLERPIYYRQPTESVGSVFFRRPGPDEWRGNVLSEYFLQHRRPEDRRDDPYASLPVVTVRYDEQGFRNPDDLDDWQMVVVGDSFTEAGYLRQEDLFSDVAASRLGIRARNLGVSFTGPATYNFYLTEYGASPSLRVAVLAFFEGNDFEDLHRERLALAQYARQGKRPNREIVPQTSLLRFAKSRIDIAIFRARERAAGRALGREAEFNSKDGWIPVDFLYAPSASIPKKNRAHVAAELRKWSASARALGAEPWLLYLPAKRRVLEGRLRFAETANPAFSNWVPGNLPAEVAQLAAEEGIRFVDPTLELKAQAFAGRIPYNSIFDTHLNALGSHVVGEVLADAIAKGPPTDPSPLRGAPVPPL